jgi:5-methylcytosine-specific restriction endonuclease McrA
MNRETIKQKYNGLCAYTGKPLSKDWQIDHVTPKVNGANNELNNLLPACRKVNLYKGCRNLEEFRYLMITFHVRLAKLPKKTNRPETMNRIKSMHEIARLFDITPEKPFEGKFYFEKLKL